MTEDGEPYVTEKAQRAASSKALKKLNIPHRPMKNTRHTYASYMLMRECKPSWVAQQMGHAFKVLLNSYAGWISGDNDETEMRKLDSAIS